MAVVLQDVCGTEDSGYFFPTLSGVARSINFYPLGSEKSEDGIVNLAFGLGKLVVEGGKTLRFSPKHPKHVLQLSTPALALTETQNEMYALDLKPEMFKTSIDDAVNLERFKIADAKHFRNMNHVASTWDMNNQRVVDSNFEDGRKIITFSHILKYDTMPLAEILSDLLDICQKEMRSAVEIEFAVNMDVPSDEDKIFNFLQIRPITESLDNKSLDWEKMDVSNAVIYSQRALGAGLIEKVTDIIYIREEHFDSAKTKEMAQEIDKLNNTYREEGKGYILVGPGRWGSSDPWLGIPVKWPNISEAKVIVECGMKNFQIEPSQGTHFFQNLTSFGIGYLTINPFNNDGLISFENLNKMDAKYETNYIRVVSFQKPLYIFIDGRKNKGIVKQIQ